MLFNSPIFLFFFLPIFFIIYFSSKDIERKNIIISIFSTIFFIWGDLLFFFITLSSSLVDYYLAKKIYKSESNSNKIFLFISIAVNLLLLFYFKYFNFLIDQFNHILYFIGYKSIFSEFDILFPLGISFITFHKISFIIDIYRKNTSPPYKFINFYLYIFYFPQLIAGPIIRYKNICNQIIYRNITFDNLYYGSIFIIIGLAKKIIIADNVGVIADQIFDYNGSLSWYYYWIGALAYTIQIYFDFSGYSDIAIGIARCCGFTFPKNFNFPYQSISVTDFWRRWHITLSEWMRDYLYIPLGGNKLSTLKQIRNLWIVFILSGLWHGASWNFIFWGIYHGFFLTIEKFVKNIRLFEIKSLLLKRLITFFIILNSWILFRANNLDVAYDYYYAMYSFNNLPFDSILLFLNPHKIIILVIALLCVLFLKQHFLLNIFYNLNGKFNYSKNIFITLILFLTITFLYGNEVTSFLYFRF